MEKLLLLRTTSTAGHGFKQLRMLAFFALASQGASSLPPLATGRVK